MKLEDKHCTPEQAQKLIELGVVLETEKYWIRNSHKGTWYIGDVDQIGYDKQGNLEHTVPAPDVPELLDILDKHTNFAMVDIKPKMAEYLCEIVIKEAYRRAVVDKIGSELAKGTA